MNKISRMTLGTVQLGLNYGIANKEGKPDIEKAYSILDKAVETGVDCLDTAAGYGDSESVIGGWMKDKGIARGQMSIVTKFSLGDIEPDEVETVLTNSVEQSLKALGTGYVDYLLMHHASEYAKYKKQIDKTISKLLERNVIRNAGVSGYSFEEIKPVLENDAYSAFQLPVNMLDFRITDKEANALRNKMVFARSVYLQGLFFMNPDELYGNLREISPFIKKVRGTAKNCGCTVAELAMRYVNSLEYVDSLVVGADKPEHVKNNADLINAPKFSQEMMDKIKTGLRGAPDWLFYPWLWDRKED